MAAARAISWSGLAAATRTASTSSTSLLLIRPTTPFSLRLRLPLAPSSPLSSYLPATLASLFPADSLSALRELLPPWVLAVPKSKTSHSKKKMRSSNKGLKEQQGIVACPSCGTPKRAHHLCHACHVDFRQTHHREAKDRASQDPMLHV